MSIKRLIYLLTLSIFLISFYLGLVGRFFNMTWGVIMVLIILAPRIIYNSSRYLKNHYNENLVLTSQILLAISSAISGLGTLGFNYLGIEYDSFQHFFVGIFFGIGIAILLIISSKTPFLNQKLKISLLTIFLTLFLATIVWESYQYFGDKIFGTEMYGQKNQPLDTFYDVGAVILSLPFTLIWIYKYSDKFFDWISKNTDCYR